MRLLFASEWLLLLLAIGLQAAAKAEQPLNNIRRVDAAGATPRIFLVRTTTTTTTSTSTSTKTCTVYTSSTCSGRRRRASFGEIEENPIVNNIISPSNVESAVEATLAPAEPMQMESRIIREAEPHHQHRSSSYEIQPTFGHSSYRGYYRPSFILPFKDSQQQIASIATFKASNYNNSLQQRLFILTYTFTTTTTTTTTTTSSSVPSCSTSGSLSQC